MNLIFLDIDGVLNNMWHCKTLADQGHRGVGFGQPWELDKGNFSRLTVGWDPNNVEALMTIVEETKAMIVISSTWRIGRHVPFFRRCFAAFDVSPEVAGKTPEINTPGSIRGDEVNAWLEHVDADRWVCLDDDSDFHPENNLVQTNMDVGLTMEDAERAINILRGDT